jgi:hypothetical protein
MSGWSRVDAFLRTDPRDVGCGEVMEVMHVYAEAAADDPAGAVERHPGVAAHLRGCGPCATDLDGLLSAIDLTNP